MARLNNSGHGRGRALTERQKLEVVRRLACYDSVAEVREWLVTQGVEVTNNAISRYNPDSTQSGKMAEYLREHFHAVRDRFLRDLETVMPAANKMVRVKHLLQAGEYYRNRKNFMGMAKMYESAAKELGNVHTNRRELSGPGGGAVELEYGDLTDEQIQARLAALIEGAPTLGGL